MGRAGGTLVGVRVTSIWAGGDVGPAQGDVGPGRGDVPVVWEGLLGLRGTSVRIHEGDVGGDNDSDNGSYQAHNSATRQGVHMAANRTTRSSKPFLSVVEVATLLGESRSTIYRSIARGDLPIPVVVINGRLRIARKALERLIDGYSEIASEPLSTQAAPSTPSSCTRPSAASPASRSPRYLAARRSSASTPSV